MEKKWRCTVCGYVHTGDNPPERCPLCKAPASKFVEIKEEAGEISWADGHTLGVAKGCDKEIWEGLQTHFAGECSEVGMYIAMSRQADREGYPEIAEAYRRIAYEEADHAARFAELLGEVVWDTKTNLEKRMHAEMPAPTRNASPPAPRNSTTTPSMTQFTRCARTRPVTDRHSRDSIGDSSETRSNYSTIITALFQARVL